MQNTIIIDNKEIELKATAALPRLYRLKFGRDILQDARDLVNAYNKVLIEQNLQEENENLGFSAADLSIFENLAYIMAKHAQPQSVPDDIDEWMQQFELFSIYEHIGDVINLWGINTQTTSTSKKKLNPAPGNIM
jgi:hypothetical protein